MSLHPFSPATRAWFEASFETPTDAQTKGWKAIAGGRHTLLLAPTGSGKTLAAFLAAIDRLTTTPPPSRERRTSVLYVSPLRALAVDIQKNLRAPLAGIQRAAERSGLTLAHMPTVGVRTGDTDARERRHLLSHPPDILITTPESLYLMLTSSAREKLRGVRTVIVDEIHAMAATKRGTHLMLSLERLEELTDDSPQRIGLSATQRPLEEIARLLGGFAAPGRPREVAVVDDQRGSPTWTNDLARALVGLVSASEFGTYHCTNGGECTWHELAEHVIRRAGHDGPVERTTTAALARPASNRIRHGARRRTAVLGGDRTAAARRHRLAGRR